MARHFTASMFVLPDGKMIPSSATDQAGHRGADSESRTYAGIPCEACGDSYLVERKYHRPAILAAQARAAKRLLASAETWEERHGPTIRVAYGFLPETYLGIVADFVRDEGDESTADRIMAILRAEAVGTR